MQNLQETIKKILDRYHYAKASYPSNPAEARERLQNNIDELFLLKKTSRENLPFRDSKNYVTWVHNLDRIASICQDLLLQIDTQTGGGGGAMVRRNEIEWSYPSLQEPVFYEILEALFLPMIDPKAYTIYDTLLLRGKRGIGKTYFLNRLREFLATRMTIDGFVWREWSAGEVASPESSLLSPDSLHKWKVIVFDVDFLPSTLLTPQFFDAYEQLKERAEKVITVFCTATDPPFRERLQNFFEAILLPPTDASLFHFFKGTVFQQLPETERYETARQLSQRGVSFRDAETIIHNAEYVLRDLELSFGTAWINTASTTTMYTQNSDTSSCPLTLEHCLLRIPDTAALIYRGERYINAKLLSPARCFFLSYDRFENIYLPETHPSGATTTPLIGELVMDLTRENQHSPHEHRLHDLLLRFWVAFYQPPQTDLRSTRFFHDAPHIFRAADNPSPMSPCHDVVILAKDSPFEIHLGNRSTGPIPSTVSAETLSQLFADKLGLPGCPVLQLMVTDKQASYHVHMEKKTLLLIKNATLLPKLHLGSVADLSLPEDYCLTNENDLDILQEKYPGEYDKMFRNEEATWKLKPIAHHSHLLFLEKSYSREQKFYLVFYHSLLRFYEKKGNLVSPESRTILRNLLLSLQHLIDFLLVIVSETDEKEEWNGVWSMSKNHEKFDRYQTLFDVTESTRTFPADLTVELLKNNCDFLVNPYYFLELFKLFDETYYAIFERWIAYMPHPSHRVGRILLHSPAVDLHQKFKNSRHLLNNRLHISNGALDPSTHEFLLYFLARKEKGLLHDVCKNMDAIAIEEVWYDAPVCPRIEERFLQPLIKIVALHPHVWDHVCTNLGETPFFGTALAIFFSIHSSSHETSFRNLLGNLLCLNKLTFFPDSFSFPSLVWTLEEILHLLFHKLRTVLSYLKLKIPTLVSLTPPSSSSAKALFETSAVQRESSAPHVPKKKIIPRDRIKAIRCSAADYDILQDMIALKDYAKSR